MKTKLHLLLALSLAAFSGCATATSPHSLEATLAAERGAPASLVNTLQRGGRLTLADIESLAILKVPDDTTLAYLRRNGAAYELTLAQIDQMRDAGVSVRVIDYLLASPARVARTVLYPRMWFGFGHPHHGVGRHSGGFGHGFGHGGFGHRGGHH